VRDVKFVCPDGQVIPAHKCVVVASSPYFKASLEVDGKKLTKQRSR
jgi:hypothetical protein